MATYHAVTNQYAPGVNGVGMKVLKATMAAVWLFALLRPTFGQLWPRTRKQ